MEIRFASGSAAALALVAVVTGCAPLSAPAPAPILADQPGSLGVLDASYERSKWKWVRNPDGRSLLTHAALPKCFIDPQPTDDFTEPGFTVKRERRTIGGTAYQVMDVFEGRDFWEAIYRREGSREPLLGVYADGACRTEAERILETYEHTRK